jgi:transcriptional regulator
VTRAQLKARQGKKVSGSTQIEIDENGHAKLNTILDDIFNKVDANHVRIEYSSLFVIITVRF